MRTAPALLIVLLAACTDPEDAPPRPVGPPVALAYEAACDSAYSGRLVTLDGYLHLFPRLLSCYPDDDAPSGRSCQVELLPTRDAPTETAAQRAGYLTLFIDEGARPNEARATGYGFGSPLKVFAADSAEVDPYDRVRVTGRLTARDAIGEAGLRCTVDVERLDIAEPAAVSWADERLAARDSLQALVDSLAADRRRRDSLRATD